MEVGLYGAALTAIARPRRERARSAGHAGKASAVLLCVAALLIVSSAAMVTLGNGNAAGDQSAQDVRQPPPPKNVQGYVYYSDGVTPVVNCLVNVTNTRTGDWNLTITDDTYGWYEFNMNDFLTGVLEGDLINVTAIKDLDIGWVEGTAGPAFLDLNVIMSGTLIPEFPMVVLPVVGLMALFAVVGLERRKKAQ
jgi:hypothetical protein